MFGDLLRCAHRNDVSSCISPFRTQVDDMVGALNHVHIMLDDYYGVTGINQRFEAFEEL